MTQPELNCSTVVLQIVKGKFAIKDVNKGTDCNIYSTLKQSKNMRSA